MLLGLKSTREEVELHVMAQRLHEARGPQRSGASCAAHCRPGSSTTTPGRHQPRVRVPIGDLFAAFAACGSACGVVATFRRPAVPAAHVRRGWARQLRWGALTTPDS